MSMELCEMVYVRRYQSPCGTLLLGSSADRLCLCDWQVEEHCRRVLDRLRRMMNAEFVEGTSPVIDNAAEQLDEYFAGVRQSFTIPLRLVGTDFQKRVWTALADIPYGKTVTYGELSRKIGCPTSVRAVANANGANAISIFLPCHRVIGADGSLTGYGGGLRAKHYLLALECKSLF